MLNWLLDSYADARCLCRCDARSVPVPVLFRQPVLVRRLRFHGHGAMARDDICFTRTA
jgi:hypothetical protein